MTERYSAVVNLTDAEIESRWSKGNDAGNGYAVGGEKMTPREAAEGEEFEDIQTFDTRNSTGHCVIARDGDKWVAICDANGPWAVDIAEVEPPRMYACCEPCYKHFA